MTRLKNIADRMLAVDGALLPFIIFFVTSLFLPTASHRLVFYIISVFLVRNIIRSPGESRRAISSFCFPALIAYLVYFSASSLWSSPFDLYACFRVVLDSLCIFIFVFSFAVSAPKISFGRDLAATGGLITLVAISAYAALHYLTPGTYFRLEGSGRYTNPIHLAILLSVISLLLVSTTDLKHKKSVLLHWGLIGIFTAFIFLTQSRTALLALPLSIIALGFLGHMRAALGFIGICLLALAAVTASGNFIDLFSRLDSYRFAIWREAFHQVRSHIWLGMGVLTEPGFSPVDWNPNGFKSTHNVFVGHLFTGGIAGFTLFLMLLFSAVRPVLSRIGFERLRTGGIDPLTKFTFSCLCFSVIAGCFVFTHYLIGAHIHWLIFWLPFALAWHLEIQNGKAARAD